MSNPSARPRSTSTHPTLTQRQRNRALLARQLLRERSSLTPADALDHLVGVQAQFPAHPYIGLQARLADFDPMALSDLLDRRQAVRGSLMRGTIHLNTAADYRAIRPLLDPMHRKWSRTIASAKDLPDADVLGIEEAGEAILRQGPKTISQLGDALAERFPGGNPHAMATHVRVTLPVVQITPRGTWGASLQPTWALIDDWTGQPCNGNQHLPELIRRYLRAFGPATVADITTWSGITGLRDVVTAMRDELAFFRNERGQELVDIPDGPLPDAETPAPPRFLPFLDNALLSHKDRSHIIADDTRKRLASKNGIVDATFLVDGFVAGTWKVVDGKQAATMILRPFAPIAANHTDQLVAEGESLLEMLHPNATPLVDIERA